MILFNIYTNYNELFNELPKKNTILNEFLQTYKKLFLTESTHKQKHIRVKKKKTKEL